MSPIARSVTRRRLHATKARSLLGRYIHVTTLQPTPSFGEAELSNVRIERLLNAQAEIERALWLETSGRIGDEHSTPRRILARVVVATGEESM